jgi:hypothetical protein
MPLSSASPNAGVFCLCSSSRVVEASLTGF